MLGFDFAGKSFTASWPVMANLGNVFEDLGIDIDPYLDDVIPPDVAARLRSAIDSGQFGMRVVTTDSVGRSFKKPEEVLAAGDNLKPLAPWASDLLSRFRAFLEVPGPDDIANNME